MSYQKQSIPVDTNAALQDILQDESLVLLRRICTLMQKWNMPDSQNRQQIVVDGFGMPVPSLANNSYSPSSPINPIGNLTFDCNCQIAGETAPTTSATNGFWSVRTWEGPIDQRWKIIDSARGIYADCIRSKIVE